MALNLEETARALDEKIRALLDQRDIIYSIEKMGATLSVETSRTLLGQVEDAIRAAAEAITEIDIRGAEVRP